MDKAYVILLSRYRRQLGDSQFESACRRARDSVYGYLVFLVGALVGAFMLAVAAYSGVGSALIGRELKGMQFVAVVFLLGAILFLNHRFNGIASRPSQLAREESPEDRRFFLWFRTICVGVFVLVCVVGVTLHEFGF